MRQILLVLQRISLYESPSIRMPQQVDLAEIQRLPCCLHIFYHVFDRVPCAILELLGFPRSTLINKDQTIVTCEREQVWKEIIVRRSRPTMQDDQRFTTPEGRVVQH